MRNLAPITSTLSATTRRTALRIGLFLSAVMFGPAHSAMAAEVAKFEIIARDGQLLPQQLAVPAGVKLKLTLRNEGKTVVEFESLEMKVERIVTADSVGVVTVQPLKPGSYTMIDEFGPATAKMLLIAK